MTNAAWKTLKNNRRRWLTRVQRVSTCQIDAHGAHAQEDYMEKNIVIENENGISSGLFIGVVALGDIVTITPNDENGMPSEKQTGKVIEIE
jgi:hypothetical protein